MRGNETAGAAALQSVLFAVSDAEQCGTFLNVEPLNVLRYLATSAESCLMLRHTFSSSDMVLGGFLGTWNFRVGLTTLGFVGMSGAAFLPPADTGADTEADADVDTGVDTGVETGADEDEGEGSAAAPVSLEADEGLTS